MKTYLFWLIITISITIFITAIGTAYYLSDKAPHHHKTSDNQAKNEPLYWVAPMDPNYRRDKPGKSPMGMDLVPVYANDSEPTNKEAGTVYVSPDVINNLGVRTTKVQKKPLQHHINTVGYIAYNEDKLAHIHPRVQGWVEKLYITSVGDQVTKGQALYAIYSPELVNAQEEFLLALAQKNKRLTAAAENRLIALQIPQAAINALKKTKQVKQSITFYAPQNGVITELAIREGFYVKPETMMMSIADLSEVWVRANLFEGQINEVAIGNPVNMTLDYLPAKKWQANIDHIHPMMNANTRAAIVRFSLKNQNGELKPNMFAKISIDTGSNKPVLLIPKEALIRTGQQNRVILALGQGNFKSIAVHVGQFGKHNVEIVSGLSQGDQVVSSAQFLLDSESSKSSDFKRMYHHDATTIDESNTTMPASKHNMDKVITDEHITGKIKRVMASHRMVNINIKRWQQKGAADIDFMVDTAIDMALFKQGDAIMFSFEKRKGHFVITHVMPAGSHS